MPKRVAVGDPRPVQAQFPHEADGAVTVTILSARTEAETTDTATHLGNGLYEFQLPDTMVEKVDELVLRFSGSFGGVNRFALEQVQVAGAYYFGVAEARKVGLIDSTYTDAEVEAQRMAVEDQIESNCDTSFVSRLALVHIDGKTERCLPLPETWVHRLVSVTEDGVDVTADAQLSGRFLCRASSAWRFGNENIDVVLERGYSEHPPEDLRLKAIEATRYGLLRARRTGLPPHAVQLGTEVGVLKLAVAGLRQPFGIPEVDAVVLMWAQRTRPVL